MTYGDETKMIARVACPACCGGGRIMGGEFGGPRNAQPVSTGGVAVGRCFRCRGTGRESDFDYEARIASMKPRTRAFAEINGPLQGVV